MELENAFRRPRLALILSDRYTPQQRLGKLIKVARIAAELTQSELAKRLHTTQDSVGRYERGETVPDFLMLSAIAEVLGQELDYFRVRR